jgi:hypothetical protein
MRARGVTSSGCGAYGSLQLQGFWGTNAKPAGVASTSRFQWFKPRANLDMSDIKIAPKWRQRKWYADHLARKIPGNIQSNKRRLENEARP